MKITKKWRTEKAREIIDRNVFDVPFPEWDLREFCDVTTMDIDSAVRRVNPQFPHTDPRHLHVLRDGLWAAESWKKAIQQTHTPESEAKRVMRFLVRDDMQDFKEAMQPLECEYCGAIDDLTVDHVSPPFDVIANDFIALYGTPEVTDNPQTDKVVKVFSDADLEAGWVSFHASRAMYQILCRSCNASKGRKQ